MFYSITCPYCRFPIQPLEACVICTHCRRVQHKDCWEANRHCTSEGCTGEPEEWRPEGGKTPAAEPAFAMAPAGQAWFGASARPNTAAAANARPHGVTWPVSAALAILIVWALYQCAMLAHESGRWEHGTRNDLRLVSGHATLLRYPEPSAPVLAQLPGRTEVQILSFATDYVRVQTSSGQAGYVLRNRLDLPSPPSKKPK